MANSFGPQGGPDPQAKAFGDAVKGIIPKEAVAEINKSAKAISSAISSFAKGMIKGAENLKEASIERQYNLLEEIRNEKQFRKEFAAWVRQEANEEFQYRKEIASLVKQDAKDELQYKKDVGTLMAQEAKDEIQYKKDIANAIKEQFKYEEDFYKLVKSENEKIANEERIASEDRIKRLRDDIQARAAIEDAANKERASIVASQISLENQKYREMEQNKKEILDAQISLENQKYREMERNSREILDSVLSLEKQKFDTIEKNNREILAAQISLENQKDKALKQQQLEKDKEKIAKLRAEDEYRMGGVGRLMEAVNGVVGAFKNFTGLLSKATSFVAALNPGLVLQLGFAFKDLYATIGLALQPVVEGMIAGIRTLADFLVPISKELAPLFANLTTAFLDLFVSLFPFFRDLLSVVGILTQWFTLFIKAITFLIDPIIMALTGFSVILIVEAIPAVIAFATSILTMTTLMTAGISLVIGAIASLAFWFLRTVGVFKSFDFKPGVSAGMGARQASYSGISEFGKNLLQQGLGSSTATAGLQTANNTKRCADLLQDMKDGGGWKKAAGNIMFGGPGVKVEQVGGKDRNQKANPFVKFVAGLMF